MQLMDIKYLTYPECAAQFGVSISKLKRAVLHKRLTRFQSAQDRRITLLNAEEVASLFGDEALNTPAA